MPDFGRRAAGGGDPSLDEINRADRFFEALAAKQPVFSTDPAEAELAFRGRGPPPVPSKISLVLVAWVWVVDGCENAAIKVAVPVRNTRRLQAGICRPEAES